MLYPKMPGDRCIAIGRGSQRGPGFTGPQSGERCCVLLSFVSRSYINQLSINYPSTIHQEFWAKKMSRFKSCLIRWYGWPEMTWSQLRQLVVNGRRSSRADPWLSLQKDACLLATTLPAAHGVSNSHCLSGLGGSSSQLPSLPCSCPQLFPSSNKELPRPVSLPRVTAPSQYVSVLCQGDVLEWKNDPFWHILVIIQ